MKKSILILIALVSVFSACKKDDNNGPAGNGDYQPLTKGSNWTYDVEYYFQGSTDKETSTSTITGKTEQFNGKTYHEVEVVSEGDTETGYFNIDNHIYSTRVQNGEGTIDIPYFNDAKTQGETFTLDLSNDEVDARIVTTVAEKGVKKTIAGKSFSDVTHTVSQLQIKYDNNYTTVTTFEFTWQKVLA
ncbi:hypothetical protein ACFQZX_06140 [Mucilaginibacter litoreus]|uniref:Lipid-binding hydrolase n=1 Tax=Mucilaginibacter litoreus TaxID=1048221 RepID=A0ABW3ASF6_9SPHI